MSASSHGGPEPEAQFNHDALRENSSVPSTSVSDSPRFPHVDGDDKPVETRISDDVNESRDLKTENADDVGFCDASGGENLLSCSLSTEDAKSEHTKGKTSLQDYDSILSEFDQFASKGASGDEAVGFGYEVGDMVWGKVKSHPWWPGHIYNEAFASPSVQRSKREGHVLVAFFGDSSYGWFDPSELVPFGETFDEKSRQTSSRGFLKAVEEAIDELARRRSLGLVCRCRNKFNFWPSNVKDYFVVDVGDFEPVVYSASQINKARENFNPNEMLSFLTQLALAPRSHQHWTLEFIKNKATAMACRKALFEEFDETYAQAFGTSPVCPARPSAPIAVDPSKAPLSGRLVFAEALGKRKHTVKSAKSKDQMEKDKYLFKRRDEPSPTKTKKTVASLVSGSGLSGKPLVSAKKGYMLQTSESDNNDGQLQPLNSKPSDGFIKPGEVGVEKAKLPKQFTREPSAENTITVAKKKRKKETMVENVILGEKVKKRKKDSVNLHFGNSSSGSSTEKFSEMLLDVPLTTATDQFDNQKTDDLVASSALPELELSVLVKDLCTLAVNAFHGLESSRLASTRLAVLKYRALVYQKSLASAPATEIEKSEASSKTISNDRTTMKLTKPMSRPDDPPKGGKKHALSDRLEPIKKKKKLGDTEDINRKLKQENMKNRKQLAALEGVEKKKKISNEPKKKMPDDPIVKKIPQKSIRPELPGKGRNPTMLVMKFPEGASLPSGANMRAKFGRFGPLDYEATRVFWKTHTCRLVFHHKAHAEDALKFARDNGNIFGNTNVRYYIREVGTDTPESEALIKSHAPPPLKSCLKKEDGNGRGTSRVKFVLGAEGSSKSEQVSSSYSMMDLASTTSTITTSTSKKLSNFVPQSIIPTHHQMPKSSNTSPSIMLNTTPVQQIPDAPKNDISQQLLNLLTRCNDVVNNLTGALGYLPYHPL